MPHRVITEDEAANLVSELLASLRPPGQNRSGWENELASACDDKNPSTIANWTDGKAKLFLVDGLRLMAYLGEPFAKPLLALAGLHVGLEPSEAERKLAELQDDLARLHDKAGNGRVVKLEGKIS